MRLIIVIIIIIGDTRIPDKFQKLLESSMKDIEIFVIKKKSFHIQTIPEIISKIRSSSLVSSILFLLNNLKNNW